jgi:hypothetical protein
MLTSQATCGISKHALSACTSPGTTRPTPPALHGRAHRSPGGSDPRQLREGSLPGCQERKKERKIPWLPTNTYYTYGQTMTDRWRAAPWLWVSSSTFRKPGRKGHKPTTPAASDVMGEWHLLRWTFPCMCSCCKAACWCLLPCMWLVVLVSTQAAYAAACICLCWCLLAIRCKNATRISVTPLATDL